MVKIEIINAGTFLILNAIKNNSIVFSKNFFGCDRKLAVKLFKKDLKELKLFE
jgi:hypothetical protein